MGSSVIKIFCLQYVFSLKTRRVLIPARAFGPMPLQKRDCVQREKMAWK